MILHHITLHYILSYHILLSLKMISANHRPDHCRHFSRNRDSVMISDEITDSLVSLLKVSYKNKISISVESLYYFKENQKGRKRSERRIRYKFLPKLLRSAVSKARGTLACVRSRMNEVSQVERFLSLKTYFLVRDDKHLIVQVFARFGKISGLVWSRHAYFGSTYGLAKIQTTARPNSP